MMLMLAEKLVWKTHSLSLHFLLVFVTVGGVKGERREKSEAQLTLFFSKFALKAETLKKPSMRKYTTLELSEQRLETEAFRLSGKLPLTVVLDNIRSVHNVGSVFRTADAFRLSRLCLCGITATPPSVEIHKTALGAEDSVAWTYYEDTLDAVEALRSDGYHLLAVEQVEGSISLESMPFDPTEKYALIMGNEVSGVRQDVVDRCEGAIEIPQFGTKHSLNVSVSCGIVMWELTRRFLLSGFKL